jgi:hypothetical protein
MLMPVSESLFLRMSQSTSQPLRHIVDISYDSRWDFFIVAQIDARVTALTVSLPQAMAHGKRNSGKHAQKMW